MTDLEARARAYVTAIAKPRVIDPTVDYNNAHDKAQEIMRYGMDIPGDFMRWYENHKPELNEYIMKTVYAEQFDMRRMLRWASGSNYGDELVPDWNDPLMITRNNIKIIMAWFFLAINHDIYLENGGSYLEY